MKTKNNNIKSKTCYPPIETLVEDVYQAWETGGFDYEAFPKVAQEALN